MIQLFEKNNMEEIYINYNFYFYTLWPLCQQNEIDPKEYFLQSR